MDVWRIQFYKRLPKIGQGKLGDELNEIERLYSEDSVGNGGAAMTAWSYMQFAEMSEAEREELKTGSAALLRAGYVGDGFHYGILPHCHRMKGK